MIERILNAFGYYKKQKARIILVTYRHLDGSKEVYGNLWYSTDKTGVELREEVSQKVKTSFLMANPEISEDQCPIIIIASISDLG